MSFKKEEEEWEWDLDKMPDRLKIMTYEGVNEYVFDNITPDFYTLRHTFGPVLWSGELTAAELIGSGTRAYIDCKEPD